MSFFRALCAGAAFATCIVGFASPVAAAPPALGAIKHVMVIDLENESYSTTFGANSPAVYLNTVLLKQGELIQNYFATSHVSLGNYISEVSGQEPTVSTNDDCINLGSLSSPPVVGSFNNVSPGTDDANQAAFPGQVDGDGCVFPAPTATSMGAETIGDQLDQKYGLPDGNPKTKIHWREYAEDMGLDINRDHGDPEVGGSDCAHPAIGGNDLTNTAEAADQYADRHAPFVYFHSVIDDQARCDAHVVPLGNVLVGSNGAQDVFVGHLAKDLQDEATTPEYMFVSPNLCNDGHDGTCHGVNLEGGHAGGLAGADIWLKHYMPMIFNSPAYKTGSLLVVITFDEAGASDARACPAADQSTCGSPVGPNVSNPGFSKLLGLFHVQTPPTANYQYAGGGQVGAVVFNKFYVQPGTVNSTGVYNHYSALRTYEDLLGITSGGADGHGHLGYAATPGLATFGADVFNQP
jgi:hypothetical protein